MTGIFQQGGLFFGITQTGDFEFNSWSDVWYAVTTRNHPLEKYAQYILGKRKGNDDPNRFERIRVSFDVSPPIVETVYDKSLAWAGIMFAAVILWIFFLSFLGG